MGVKEVTKNLITLKLDSFISDGTKPPKNKLTKEALKQL